MKMDKMEFDSDEQLRRETAEYFEDFDALGEEDKNEMRDEMLGLLEMSMRADDQVLEVVIDSLMQHYRGKERPTIRDVARTFERYLRVQL